MLTRLLTFQSKEKNQAVFLRFVLRISLRKLCEDIENRFFRVASSLNVLDALFSRLTAYPQNFLPQICICFDFFVYSSIHRTKNPFCSNNRYNNSITSYFFEKTFVASKSALLHSRVGS